MYETLITKIEATLAGITKVKDYFSVPKGSLTKFPAVFFKPSGLTNTFETNSENMKVYRFMMIVLIGCNNETQENIFGTVLPKTVDDIIKAFDSEWDGGSIDGHRVTIKIDSADEWQIADEKEGLMAYAPLNLEVKLLSNN